LSDNARIVSNNVPTIHYVSSTASKEIYHSFQALYETKPADVCVRVGVPNVDSPNRERRLSKSPKTWHICYGFSQARLNAVTAKSTTLTKPMRLGAVPLIE